MTDAATTVKSRQAAAGVKEPWYEKQTFHHARRRPVARLPESGRVDFRNRDVRVALYPGKAYAADG